MHPLTITLSLALLFFVFGVAGHDGTQSTPKEQPPKTHKPSPAPVKPPHKSEPKSSPKPKSTHKATSTSKSAAKPTPSSDSSPNFIINSVQYSGSGCPSGSVVTVRNVNNTGITMTFSSFEARIGSGVPRAEARETCKVTLGMSVASGYTFALTTVDYTGYYFMSDKKVSATQNSTYQFRGREISSCATWSLKGPVEGGTYTARDQFNIKSYSPCARNVSLVIDSAVLLCNTGDPDNEGVITRDTSDVAFHRNQRYSVAWKKC